MYACCCHSYTLSMRTDVAAQDLFSLHKICSVSSSLAIMESGL